MSAEADATAGECTCGYGGFHEPLNPLCQRNLHPATPDAVDASPVRYPSPCGYRMHGPGDTCDCRARLAQVTTHTRTSTPQGPDFCEECSDAVSEWVQWPCPASTSASEPLSEDERTAFWAAMPDEVTGAQERLMYAAVERIVAAREAKARADGAAAVRDDIRARRREFRRLNAEQEYLNALDDAYGLAANRAREVTR